MRKGGMLSAGVPTVLHRTLANASILKLNELQPAPGSKKEVRVSLVAFPSWALLTRGSCAPCLMRLGCVYWGLVASRSFASAEATDLGLERRPAGV